MKHYRQIVLPLLAVTALAASTASAQHNPRDPRGRAVNRGMVNANKPVNVPFDPMWKKNEQGKVVPIEGHLDLLALRNNPTVSDATFNATLPGVKEWLAEIDRITIDNLDFVEEIDAGALDNLNLENMGPVRKISEMMQMLMAAGSLTKFLNDKGLLDMQQTGVNQQIINDYQKVRMEEIRGPGVNQQNMPENEKNAVANGVNRFLFQMSSNDSMAAYHRMLADAAPLLEQILGKMDQSAVKSASDHLGAVKAATNDADKVKAVKSALSPLSFDQRRAVLSAVVEQRPDWNPMAGLMPRPASITANNPAAAPKPDAAPVGAGKR